MWRGRAVRGAIVVAGIVLCQAILFGPSLVGSRILLPLGYLSEPGVYLPDTPEYADVVSHNFALSDQVVAFQLSRRYASTEIRNGRVPLWTPYSFAGAPFAKFAKYSPFNLVYTLFPTPYSLAWIQLIKSLVAGIGAYIYFRRVLRVSFWPAAVGSWCYPIGGFLMLWQGFEISFTVAWLPWLLLHVDELVRTPESYRGAGLGVLTGLMLVSGQLDVAVLVLIGTGLYAALRWFSVYRGQLTSPWAIRSPLALTLAWCAGTALAAPYVLPLLEYSQTGDRMHRRISGAEERPPLGPSALTQVVLPDANGSMQADDFSFDGPNRLEGPAAAYAGLLAALVLAPLACCSRRHRSIGICWLVLGVAGISWTAGLPGFVDLMRVRPLNILSYNRFAFLTGLAILTLAVIGLDVLRHGVPPWRRSFWLIAVVPLTLLAWSLSRLLYPPEPISLLLRIVEAGVGIGTEEFGRVQQALRSFRQTYLLAVLLSSLAVGAWWIIGSGRRRGRWLASWLAALTIAELMWFAHDINPQTDPRLYYPRIPALAELAKATPGRILCIRCLPAKLNETHGLRDIRGYDGVDPARFLELLKLAAGENDREYSYASTQWFIPRGAILPPNIVELPETLNLLGVRYLILRGLPPTGIEPLISGGDYWVVENQSVLPRAFVPAAVELIDDSDERLRRMSDPAFDARATAYLEGPADPVQAGVGEVEIVAELPGRLSMVANMERGGLIVLADLWDRGWSVTVNGASEPIYRTYHALRGVAVPDGYSNIEFEYSPASFTWGLRTMAVGLVVLIVWLGLRTNASLSRWSTRRSGRELTAK